MPRIGPKFLVPRVSRVLLSGGVTLADRAPGLKYENLIVINRSSSEASYLRASNATEQHHWLADLSYKARNIIDDDIIAHAELIICDEEGARAARSQSSALKLLHTSYAAAIFSSASVLNLTRTEAAGLDEVTPFDPLSIDLTRINSPPRTSSCMQTDKCLSVSTDFIAICRSRRMHLIQAVRTKHKSFERALGFLAAVQSYRELHRHDIRILIKPVNQWKVALNVYDEYLQPVVRDSQNSKWDVFEASEDEDLSNRDKASDVQCDGDSEDIDNKSFSGDSCRDESAESADSAHVWDDELSDYVVKSPHSVYSQNGGAKISGTGNSDGGFHAWPPSVASSSKAYATISSMLRRPAFVETPARPKRAPSDLKEADGVEKPTGVSGSADTLSGSTGYKSIFRSSGSAGALQPGIVVILSND